MPSDQMKRLLDYLASVPAGPISDTAELEVLLSNCWDEFDGHNAEGMEGYKVHNRMQEVLWEPPNIFFTIERQGEAVHGSSRAFVQQWAIDVNLHTASLKQAGYAQDHFFVGG